MSPLRAKNRCYNSQLVNRLQDDLKRSIFVKKSFNFNNIKSVDLDF